MALQVWMPLDGDIHNQGLINGTTDKGTYISFTNGKIGQCATSSASNNTIRLTSVEFPAMFENGKTYTLTCWVKATGNASNGWVIKIGSNTCGLWWAKSSARWVWNENDNGKRLASSPIADDYTNWHHIASVIDKTVSGKITAKHYVDGVLSTEAGTATWDCSSHSQPAGNYIDIYPYNALINDVRIYDHALSPREVAEIAKGLVLHYPLNREGFGQDNMLVNTLNDASSTHSTYNIADFNFSESVIEGDTYTVSAHVTTSSEKKSVGFFHSGGSNIMGDWIPITSDGVYKQTFVATSTMASFTAGAGHGYCRVYTSNKTGSQGSTAITGTANVDWIKIEKGDKATPWTPNSSDTIYSAMELNSNIVYDCSGYRRDGTASGSITYDADSPRYNVSTMINSNTSYITTSFYTGGFGNSYSFSWWAKVPDYSNKMMWGFADGVRLNGVYNGNLWNTGDGSNNPIYKPGTTTQVTAPTGNVWHHFVMTGNGTKNYLYVDGALYGESKTYKSISGTNLYINGWNNATNYKYQSNFLISDFRIYATALTAQQVLELYQTPISLAYNGVLLGTELQE